MGKVLIKNYNYHNILDLITGILIVVGYFFIGKSAFVFFSLYALHIFIKREGDEREIALSSRSNGYAFNLILGVIGLFSFCCKSFFVPVVLIGLSLMVRGVIGNIVFLKN